MIIVADENLRTLMDFRYKRKYEAPSGEDGKKKQQYGKGGENLIIKVPVGTLVIDAQTKGVMKDLKAQGEQCGGRSPGDGAAGATCTLRILCVRHPILRKPAALPWKKTSSWS